MNYAIVLYIIGWVLNIESALMLLPVLTALIYRETAGLSFLITIVICLAVGVPLTIRKPKNNVFYLKEGFASVALSWVALSVFGALPFVFSGAIPNFIDALFETVSGFTTTGASILADVESLPRSVLFWRSFTHWIGGMGVLVFLLAILPMVGGSHMNLMKAESPGPSVTRILPKVRSSAAILYIIYIVITVVEIVLLLLGDMPLFDAITLSLGTAGTGGFGIKNDSIGSYSAYLQGVITIFMILFGVNFNFYFFLLQKKWRQAFSMEEVRWYLGVILAAALVIAVDVRGLFSGFGEAFQQAIFQVGSIITTTGYSTADFDLWPQLSRTILVLLMFLGACAGSTGGGIKFSRIMILFKASLVSLNQSIHPRAVKKVRMDGKTVEPDVIRSAQAYLTLYVLLFAASVLLISLDGFDLTTNFTAVAATFNNIGPGLAQVGPTCNFSMFSDGAKLLLSFDMLAGRLELFPILILFLPGTWKKF